MSDIKIKEAKNIVAIEIILNTYKLDVLKYTSEQIIHLIELLTQIEPSLPKLTKKANENSI